MQNSDSLTYALITRLRQIDIFGSRVKGVTEFYDIEQKQNLKPPALFVLPANESAKFINNNLFYIKRSFDIIIMVDGKRDDSGLYGALDTDILRSLLFKSILGLKISQNHDVFRYVSSSKVLNNNARFYKTYTFSVNEKLNIDCVGVTQQDQDDFDKIKIQNLQIGDIKTC